MACEGRRLAAGEAPVRRCNLERFLEAVAPVVPASYFPKRTTCGLRRCGASNLTPFFALNDLWEGFKECSAYGTGVPIALNGGGNGVVQYYVPYLSAIQLYSASRQAPEDFRRICDKSSSYLYHDSTSEGSSDHEHERDSKMDTVPAQEQYASSSDDLSSDDGASGNCHGQLLYEFLEFEPPYQREPLAAKMSTLARQFPGLKTLRSCELSPESWISVAWYPIYRIPSGPTLRDLDACFLTYHSLSTQSTGENICDPKVTDPQRVHGVPVMTLPAFGLASYKFKAPMWAPSGGDKQLASSLLQAADTWLRLLHVDHPDYLFFATRGTSGPCFGGQGLRRNQSNPRVNVQPNNYGPNFFLLGSSLI